MSALGYANVDRRSGLDLEHFKHVLIKAAKWHAATAVLVNEVSLCLCLLCGYTYNCWSLV